MLTNWGYPFPRADVPGAGAFGVGRHCPIAVLPAYEGGARLNPSANRQFQISLATNWPHPTPLAIAADESSALMTASATVRRASNVACWFVVNKPPVP